jgi:hypothetical protein
VKRSGLYPRVHVDTEGTGVVSQAGGAGLVETVRVAGLDRALSWALAPWRKPTAVHDPAKVITDLALALALGGDCLADVAVLRAEPGVFGLVASDPTVSRAVDTSRPAHRRRSTRPVPRLARRYGGWLVGAHPTAVPAPTGRWSSTPTPR